MFEAAPELRGILKKITFLLATAALFSGYVSAQDGAADSTCRRYTEAMKNRISTGAALSPSDVVIDSPDYEKTARLKQFMKMQLLGLSFKPDKARDHVASGQFYLACIKAYKGN